MEHRFGWRRSRPDRRDFLFSARPRVVRSLPQKVELRDAMPPVYDQGDLGSCTANAVGAVFQFDQMKQQAESFVPSRLFIYYNERVIEGTVPYDAGAEMRDSIKAVVKSGVVPEPEWPYDVSKFAEAPPQESYDHALHHQGLVYSAVQQSLCQMQAVLASGFPFIFGFSVYDSFEFIGSDAICPMPGPDEGVLGGHAVVAVGYDNARRLFTVRNSWGESWGEAGYFYMPYEYLQDGDLSADFWVLQTVEEGA